MYIASIKHECINFQEVTFHKINDISVVELSIIHKMILYYYNEELPQHLFSFHNSKVSLHTNS